DRVYLFGFLGAGGHCALFPVREHAGLSAGLCRILDKYHVRLRRDRLLAGAVSKIFILQRRSNDGLSTLGEIFCTRNFGGRLFVLEPGPRTPPSSRTPDGAS